MNNQAEIIRILHGQGCLIFDVQGEAIALNRKGQAILITTKPPRGEVISPAEEKAISMGLVAVVRTVEEAINLVGRGEI